MVKKRKIIIILLVIAILLSACVPAESLPNEFEYASFIPLDRGDIIYGISQVLQSTAGTMILTSNDVVIFIWSSQNGMIYNFALVTLNPTGMSTTAGIMNMIRNGSQTTIFQGSDFIRQLENIEFRYITAADLPVTLTATIRTWMSQKAMQGMAIWSNVWPTIVAVPLDIFNAQSLDQTLEDAYGFSIAPIDG